MGLISKMIAIMALSLAWTLLPAMPQDLDPDTTWPVLDTDDTEINQPFEDEVVLPGEVRPVDDARLDHALDVYKADESLQTERPEFEPEPVDFQRREPGPFARWLASLFGAIAPIIGYLLIGVLAVALLIALYFVFGESLSLRGRQKVEKTEPIISEAPDLRPEKDTAKALLEDADALAAAGRFAEAVHLLLFRSIDDIQEKQQGSVPRSLTAREIGRLDTLPKTVRGALSPIIQIVERSFFGGRPVDASGWQAARQSYESFAFGEVWA